jgi:hypothetical protein
MHRVVTPARQEADIIAAPLLALVFGSHLVVTAAEGVPTFDTPPGCRAAASLMPASAPSH